MSGFSADWLALREPADHAARDPALLAMVAEAMPDERPVVLDLGCGAGSNLRAIAPHLAARQAWTLVDHDPGLLGAARTALTGWADAASATDAGSLRLAKAGKIIEVVFAQADLAAEVETVLARPHHLVTAAALIDLVSSAWVDRLAAAAAKAGSIVYAALSYDGSETWLPPHPTDAAMLAAFHAHQGRDKGFGQALGPRAAPYLAKALAVHGYRVATADSSWNLGADDTRLIAALAEGSADAVAETGRIARPEIEAWRAARRTAAALRVGHQDLAGLPQHP